MKRDLEYVRPDTLDEVLEFLWEHGKETKIIAGGTDIMVDLRAGKLNVKYLMDISCIEEIAGIEAGNNDLSIGSGVTLSEIHDSKIVGRYAPALQKASFKFASKQIRNMATIGGNVGNASPSADTVPPMIVHETVAVLRHINGERRVSIEDLFVGPYRSAVRPEEIIVSFLLKTGENLYADFQKIARRKALAIARMNMALLAGKDGEGKINFIRIALGSSTPTPMRVTEVESLLEGRRLDSNLLMEGGRLMAEKMIGISGRRPSTVYKEKAVQGLFLKMLNPLV
ncbi:MAG TPA: FAD binding domain-containing protein [Desulfobacteraceae bacterium]|nr:FAD binding domain-containing protein [Desulfobacteraceae bacterium]HPJ68015.1 FAD binding domain-containing protein [Desulfobacteraceae bacterium]